MLGIPPQGEVNIGARLIRQMLGPVDALGGQSPAVGVSLERPISACGRQEIVLQLARRGPSGSVEHIEIRALPHSASSLIQEPFCIVLIDPSGSTNFTVGLPSSNPTYGKTCLQFGHTRVSPYIVNVRPARVPPACLAALKRTVVSAWNSALLGAFPGFSALNVVGYFFTKVSRNFFAAAKSAEVYARDSELAPKMSSPSMVVTAITLRSLFPSRSQSRSLTR
jgi:hypothetical protein